MPYTPQIDDYVKWDHSGHVDQGWVYFKCDDYITIEVRVKDKPKCEYTKEQKHKKIHVLIVCYAQFWSQLEYLKNRRNINIDEYKSQEGRYLDPQ